MSLSVGIVGLPNVGKSTLFNALLKKQQALAANYPFATIEPNTGIVEVPDSRLAALSTVVVDTEGNGTQPPLKPAIIEVVDIAGLVAGASKGEGLGNQFLSHTREVNLICHVLRAFEDPDVVLTGALNPIDDLQTVRTELALKDMETLEKQDKTLKREKNRVVLSAHTKALQLLSDGQMLGSGQFSPDEWEWLRTLTLLTTKPEIFAINVDEKQLVSESVNRIVSDLSEDIKVDRQDIVVICAKVEAELAELSAVDQLEYLKELGLEDSGIERMAQVAYHKLDLISFLTAGAIEVKAWTIPRGTKAPQAAGVIHTDFEKKFIKADVVGWQDFVSAPGWKKARELGKVRMEGREYVMRDGDVVEFKIGS